MWCLLYPVVLVALFALAIVAAVKKAKLLTLLLVCAIVITNIISQSFALQLFQHMINSEKTQGCVRVLEYNVCNGGEYMSAHTDKQAFGLINSIQSCNADIIVLCELEYKDNGLLIDTLKVLYPYNTSECFEGNQSTHVYSKLPIKEVQWLLYDHGKNEGINSASLVVNAESKSGLVKIVACHFTSNKLQEIESKGLKEWRKTLNDSYKRRASEANALRDSIDSWNCPSLIIGDFNDIGGSYTLRHIMGKDLADAWWEKGFGYGHTFHGHNLFFRLDHILYSKEHFKLKGVKVLNDWKYSDHYPIVADLELK